MQCVDGGVKGVNFYEEKFVGIRSPYLERKRLAGIGLITMAYRTEYCRLSDERFVFLDERPL
jgi:hypothetical protein